MYATSARGARRNVISDYQVVAGVAGKRARSSYKA
jgi:hypothetical protein